MEPVHYAHFTDPLSEAGLLLHCLHSFLVLVGRFSEGCSCDVLLGPCMAVHAHGYSADTESQGSGGITGRLQAEATHAHLGHLGHLAPNRKYVKIKNFVGKFKFISVFFFGFKINVLKNIYKTDPLKTFLLPQINK